MTKPLVLIDVDGVLNAISCQRVDSCECHPGWLRRKALGFPLLLNPAHGPWLLELAETTGAELVWGSTWESLANEHIGPAIGLPELPWVPMPPRKFSGHRDLKAVGFVPWTAGRPFTWFDDESMELEAVAYHTTQPFLGIEVDGRTGLAEKHITLAREWLEGLNHD